MGIKAIKNRDSLVDEVFEQMKDQIVSGEWGPGEQIPSENELSEVFNVSRATIRNSIQKLKAIGILSTIQGRGTFVRKTISENLAESLIPLVLLDKDNIIEILEFRKTVEMESVRLAAERADQDDLVRIKRALDGMLQNQDDPPRYSMADYQFHLAIARASRNMIFLRVMTDLKDLLFSHFSKMNRDLGTSLGLDYHVAIYEAIEKRDPASASGLICKNLELSINRLQEHHINNGSKTGRKVDETDD